MADISGERTRYNETHILDLWYSIDLLTQEDYPSITSEKNNLKRSQDPRDTEIRNYDEFRFAIHAQSQEDPKDTILKALLRSKHKLFKTVTFYACKIPRQSCIDTLVKILHREDLNIDADYSKIAGYCFQCEYQESEEGRSELIYIKDSLNISPLLWALKQITDQGTTANSLDWVHYEELIEYLEKKNFMEEEEPAPINSKRLQAFSKFIVKDYINKYCTFSEEFPYVEEDQLGYDMIFTGYVSRDAKANASEEEPAMLSSSFFLEDLRQLKNALCKRSKDAATIKRYIASSVIPMPEIKRHDIIHIPENNLQKDAFTAMLAELASASKLPLGKWPSPYDPTFQQQIAINLFTGTDQDIFSINGPPGTGKTTLLKEVVAWAVVEKARTLMECGFMPPDDFFQEQRFRKQYKAYNGCIAKFYTWAFHDNENPFQYGITVASCNNSAVENVSKEFPSKKNLEDSLTGKDGQRTGETSEIAELFLDQDAYYAEKGHIKGTEEIWGLVAAILGKQANIHPFADNVLQEIMFDGVKNKERDQRLQEYKKAFDEFKNQYEKTKQIRDDLASYSSLYEQYYEERVKEQKLTYEINKLKRQLQKISPEYKHIEDRYLALQNEFNSSVQAYNAAEKRYNDNNAQITQNEFTAERIASYLHHLTYESSWTQRILRKLFKSQQEKHEQELESIRNQLQKAQAAVNNGYELQKIYLDERNRRKEVMETVAKRYKDVEEEYLPIKAEYDNLSDKLSRKERGLIKCTNEITSTKTDIKLVRLKICDKYDLDEDEMPLVVDEEYVSRLTSEDEKISGDAHEGSPWTFPFFDREREKTFFYALQFIRGFYRASTALKENLRNLYCLWKRKFPTETDYAGMSEEDKYLCALPAFQALSFIVPVFSTTFASVGRMFKYLPVEISSNNPEKKLGILIVDEAGQATPQMAAGAIARFKRALIVGDPRQIAPVVTNDVKTLMQILIPEDMPDKWKFALSSTTASVQEHADYLNPYGTYYTIGEGEEWVGCPLVIHRRCIDPMFSISNHLSYDGIMRGKAKRPSEDQERLFVFPESCWIDISGDEEGQKNHYVKNQGLMVMNIIKKSLMKRSQNGSNVRLYIISPFKTIEHSMKRDIRQEASLAERLNENASLTKETPGKMSDKEDGGKKKRIKRKDWVTDSIGTVHRFQGKETEEVVFLLGCSPKSEGAVEWVNRNIVNVAVSRAKYRLYVIGDAKLWENNSNLKMVLKNLPVYDVGTAMGIIKAKSDEQTE